MKRMNFYILTAALTALMLSSFALNAVAETEEIIVNNKFMWLTDWSPDGKYIAFAATKTRDSFIVDVETGEIKNVTEHIPRIITEAMLTYDKMYLDINQSKARPCFSADSKEVYFTQDNAYMLDGGGWHFTYIRKVNIETGEYETIREDGRGAVVSDDGRYIHLSLIHI